jgi:hypothetical protein
VKKNLLDVALFVEEVFKTGHEHLGALGES